MSESPFWSWREWRHFWQRTSGSFLKKRIVLLGPPASGKGTQAEMIQAHLKIPTVSPGQVLREELRAGSSLGREAAEYTRKGHLVPDAMATKVVESWLQKNNGAFVFDGFPRSLGQAKSLEPVLKARQTPIETVILFELPLEIIRE